MSDRSLENIENVWGALDRPLWIVTSQAGGRRGGLVATWVMQTSLDPRKPSVAVGIAPNHHTRRLIDGSQSLGLHLLRADQIACVEVFAGASGEKVDKLAGVAHHPGRSGSPILVDCLAWLDCVIYAELDTGDRIYYWADIIEGDWSGESDDLLREHHLGALPGEVLRNLREDRERDIQLQAPLAAQWREGLPSWLKPGGASGS